MPVVPMPGCRNDSLLGYLKALGVLRLLSTQSGKRIQGRWEDTSFALDSPISADEILSFFITSYAPTPILNPWNSGAGLMEKLTLLLEY
jgi:CRISPR-associated protein Csx17